MSIVARGLGDDALVVTAGLGRTIVAVVVSRDGFLSPAQALRIERFQEEEEIPVFTRDEFEKKFMGGRRKANRVIVQEVKKAVQVLKGPTRSLEGDVDKLLAQFTLDTGQVHFEGLAQSKKALKELRELEKAQALLDDEEFIILLSLM